MKKENSIESFILHYIKKSKTSNFWLNKDCVEYNCYYNHPPIKEPLSEYSYDDIVSFLKKSNKFCCRFNDGGLWIGPKNELNYVYHEMYSRDAIIIMDLDCNRQINLLCGKEHIKSFYKKIKIIIESIIKTSRILSREINTITLLVAKNMYYNSNQSGAYFHVNENKNYEIVFDYLLFHSKDLDTNLFECVLLHEFTHADDHYCFIKSNPYCKKLDCFDRRKKKDFIAEIGYHYFTEFHSYLTSNNFFGTLIETPSFNQLFKLFKQIESLYDDLSNKKSTTQQAMHMDLVFSNIEQLITLLCIHQAGLNYALDTDFLPYLKDAEKAEKKYGILFVIYMHILSVLKSVLDTTHENFYDNMHSLGNCIYSSVYDYFNIKIKKHDGEYTFAQQYE